MTKSVLPTLKNNIPINNTARRVVLPGFHFNDEVTDKTRFHREGPLKTAKYRKHSDTFIDLTSLKFGRFTVLGLLDKKYLPTNFGRGKGRWLVRCCCGSYETRTSKSIKSSINTKDCSDRCMKCRKLLFIQRMDHKNLYGVWPDENRYI